MDVYFIINIVSYLLEHKVKVLELIYSVFNVKLVPPAPLFTLWSCINFTGA